MSFAISPHHRSQSMQAFGLAILIELAIVVGAVAILVGSAPVKPAFSEPVPITLTELPQQEKPPEPKPLPPPPTQQPKLKAMVKPAPAKPQPPQPPQEAPPVAVVPTEIAAVPTAFTQPAASPPAPPPLPSRGKADAQATYAAKVNAAVQAAHALHYPAAAAATRFNGLTQVEFQLRDGLLQGEPRVLKSCGNGIFDRSALQAVQLARYPEPPTELRGDELTIKVWVEFIGR